MKHPRRGAFLLEAAVAGAMLAILLTLSLRLMTVAANERRTSEKRAIAIEQLASMVERARMLGWQKTNAQQLADLALPSSLENLLPGAALRWEVEEVNSGPPAKMVRAELRWQSPTAGAAPLTTRLTYWTFAPPAAGGAAP
jgi:hypothetical protein